MNLHDTYMQRAFELAKLGGSAVKTNPKVGSVIVYNNKIIGEGYHEEYGKAHAEVNAINNVSESDKHLLKKSSLYVTLEPCNHFGKTPPCTDNILKNQIPNVYISSLDPNPKMQGKSIEMLRNNGIHVEHGILEEGGNEIIQVFKTGIEKQRPRISLKVVQSKDHYIGKKNEYVWLSNQYSKTFSHKLRTEVNAILIGRKTAEIDDPQLTPRLFQGNKPLRIVIDKDNQLDKSLKIFTDGVATVVVNSSKDIFTNNSVEQWSLDFEESFLESLLNKMYLEKNIGSLLIEGGATTIKHFVKSGLWDEAFVITTPQKLIEGIPSPHFNGRLFKKMEFGRDVVHWIVNS